MEVRFQLREPIITFRDERVQWVIVNITQLLSGHDEEIARIDITVPLDYEIPGTPLFEDAMVAW